MIKLTEVLNAQSAESGRLVAELKSHMEKLPDILQRYEIADRRCIELAGRLNAARAAGSPTAFPLEAELRLARADRDREKHNHGVYRDEIHRKLDKLTGPDVQKFSEECTRELRSLGDRYIYRKLGGTHDVGGRRVAYEVEIETNADALGRLRDELLQASHEVQAMRHCSLPAIKAKIAEWKRRFWEIDLEHVVRESVTPLQATDRQPAENSGTTARGILQPDGSIHIFKNQDPGRLSKLADRISRLEKETV